MKILTTLLLGLSLIGSANADESVTVYALPVTKAQVGMLGMRHPYNYNSGMDRGTDLQLLIIQSGKLSKKAKTKWISRIEATGSVVDDAWAGSVKGVLGLSRYVDLAGGHYWVGVDALDAAVQVSEIVGIPDYVRTKTSIYLGKVIKAKGSCQIELYGVAGVAWYDNLTHGEQESGRPVVGSKGAFTCKSASISYDVDHAVTYGTGDTTQFEIDADYLVALRDFDLRVGLFANFDQILRNSPSVRDGATVPYLRDDISVLKGGVRFRF